MPTTAIWPSFPGAILPSAGASAVIITLQGPTVLWQEDQEPLLARQRPSGTVTHAVRTEGSAQRCRGSQTLDNIGLFAQVRAAGAAGVQRRTLQRVRSALQ